MIHFSQFDIHPQLEKSHRIYLFMEEYVRGLRRNASNKNDYCALYYAEIIEAYTLYILKIISENDTKEN